MDLHLHGRGTRITDHLRAAAQHKLGRLERMEPNLTRLDIEVISEKNPRQGGIRRVEAVADTPRKTYRAHADAPEVESALDAIAEKLERQIRDHHTKRRAKLISGASRVKSAQVTREDPGGEEPSEPPDGTETT
jgi:ribosomal subunit interface protein